MVALRKESAIVERQFVSTWSGKTYTGWWLDRRMVGCSCGYRKGHPFTDCKHMAQHNNEDSCVICGAYTRRVVCFNCIR